MWRSRFDTFMFCMLTLCASTLSNIHVLWRLRCVHLRYVAKPRQWLNCFDLSQWENSKWYFCQRTSEYGIGWIVLAVANEKIAMLHEYGNQLSWPWSASLPHSLKNKNKKTFRFYFKTFFKNLIATWFNNCRNSVSITLLYS